MADHLTYDDLERYAAAARLRAEADADQAKADAMAPDDNPMFQEHLTRLAAHKRWMANNRDGGLGNA